MNGLILFADGFEDVEALAPRDLLIRAGVNMTSSSIKEDKIVMTSHGVSLLADKSIKEINDKDYDFIILPGGGRGTQNLLKSDEVNALLKRFNNDHKLICAICAAPMVLAKAGLLKNKKYTCFAGCNEGLDGIFTAEEVVKDDNIITARSMLFSVPFALKIIESLLGKEKRDEIYRQINGL